MDTETEVLENILPEEREIKKSREMFEKVRKVIKEEFGLEAELMGSLAKNTFLKGDKDLDIFVFFPKETGREELEEKGLDIGKTVFKKLGGEFEVEYAEHPYTKGEIDGYEVEVIPAYKIKNPENMRSSVDRTPMHTEWVNKNLSEKEKEQVVLLKKFLKGTGLYGSSLKVKGFAGYLCEILIAKYGSFKNLLQACQKWKKKQFIDIEEHHKKLPKKLEKRFKEDSLIVIDPTDPERNVASVLSLENYSKFVYEAWKYLKDPSKKFFFPEKPSARKKEVKKEIKSRGQMYSIIFDKPDLTDDILYPQLRKLLGRIEDVVKKNEFRLFESGFYVSESEIKILLDLQETKLPDKQKHYGPKVFHNTKNIRDFTTKYPNTWVEEDTLTTIVERDHKKASELLKTFLDGDLASKGVPKNLVEKVEEREIMKVKVSGDQEWLNFLHSFLHIEK